MPNTVFRLDFILRLPHRTAHDHGVSAGDVLHQCVAETGRALDAGAQTDGLEMLIDKLGTTAIQAHRLVDIIRMPSDGPLQFVFQPYVVLITISKQIRRIFDLSILYEVKEIARGGTLAGPVQHSYLLANSLGKLSHDVERVVG